MFLTRITSSNAVSLLRPLTVVTNEKSAVFSHVVFGFRSYTMQADESEPISSPKTPVKNISKAMKAYLDRAHEHDEFMKQQRVEFQIGKRHLANMMGEDPETFTQQDIDNAIEYLFPSGLYQKKARPLMKPPEEVFPQRKAAEFDETGRPYHFLFYTSRPNFYELLHIIVSRLQGLNKFEDSMIRKGNSPDPNLTLDFAGYKWIDKEALENRLVETISNKDYDAFLVAMERLFKHPYCYKEKEFIYEYAKPIMSVLPTSVVPKLLYDSDGRAYVTTYECSRKTAKGDVTVRSPGTGKITINGQGIAYFKDANTREQVLFPLIFTDMQNKVDVECNIEGGGPSGQAGALRYGIATSLKSFVDDEMREKMRIAGILTRDYRTRERKKPGQAGARKKFTWKKR